MSQSLPDYVKASVPNAMGARSPWYKNTAPAYFGIFLWLPLVPVLVGNILWLNGVRKLGPVIAALFMNLIPICAVLITAALGIEPTRQQLIGGAVVLASILLAQLRR